MCTNYSFRIESERYQILASNVKGSIKAKGMQIIESKAKAMQTVVEPGIWIRRARLKDKIGSKKLI